MDKFLKDYLSTNSPSGLEDQAQKMWVKQMCSIIPSLDNSATYDAFGNAVLNVRPKNSAKPIKILIASHVDEISWRVSHIEDNGLIRVIRNGGSDHTVALGSPCIIMSGNHKIEGVFGQTAIHIRENDDVSVDKLFVDVGAKDKEDVLSSGIDVGELVVMKSEPTQLMNGKISSKAIDNKIGGYILTKVAEYLYGEDGYGLNNVELVFANCVQEETGLRGSKMVAFNNNYDIAIVTDVCHATDTPNVNKAKVGDVKLGGGAVVCRGSLLCENLVSLMRDINEADKQFLATREGTGTDADSFSMAMGGKLTALIKTPLRYMHTQTEVCSLVDVKNIVVLIGELVKRIDVSSLYWKEKSSRKQLFSK